MSARGLPKRLSNNRLHLTANSAALIEDLCYFEVECAAGAALMLDSHFYVTTEIRPEAGVKFNEFRARFQRWARLLSKAISLSCSTWDFVNEQKKAVTSP